ncbi:hypothetical protein FGG08_003361 [Glutinoglossum americanum]|uniref:Peptidase M16 C-terminal domain-containing protein n=1 Tax=Glutinoglossum americanum TaxID=1670608 RepID=A0A9P8HYH3_9PEZI|nr:hypothetical protein FGG08_003361 [Glutinoglossum americanum]
MPDIRKKTFFRTLQKFETDYSPCTITQYESERTGMRAIVVDRKGPKVRGFFALATEIHDDSGALAQLPVYLEHVLFPTLTDSGCYTEVHHIDGTGHDAGVVYSEMQGVQNNPEELMDLKARRLLYPEGIGFRYETGGMLEQLRVLTADRIREFHREMYHPKNLCLVIIGEVDHRNLLEVLDKFETPFLDDLPKPSDTWKRPWIESTQPPPLKESVIETVEFPEDDESMGEISISFFGPDGNDSLLTSALGVLMVYLCGSSISILENTLVEREQLASGIYYDIDWRLKSVISFTISGVATGQLAEVEKRFFEVLSETASKPLDMAYVLDCIRRQKRQTKSMAEASGYFFSDPVISDHLFGKRDGSTLRDLESLREYDVLEKWGNQQWTNFLREWISDAAHVTILGRPSKKLSKKLKMEEKARVERQKKRLGEKGLKELEMRLRNAKASNDIEVPRSLLEQFKIPGTDSIHFIKTITARSGFAKKMGPLDNRVQKIIDQDGPDLPLFIHFESVPSNFVHINIVLCTEKIPVEKRPLLSIYLTNFFNTPIIREGKRIEFEEVVVELEKDTVSYSIDPSLPELVRVKLEVEPDKYEAAVRWIKEALWESVFDETSGPPRRFTDDDKMLWAVDSIINYAPESTNRARNTLVKAVYLKRINRLLKDEPETVIEQLNELRKCLCTPENIRVLVIGDIEKLPSPVSTWKSLVDDHKTDKTLSPIDRPSSRLSDAGRKPGNLAYVIQMPTIDSSFSIQTARGPDTYDHPELPALLVATAYLDAVEGPLWCAVRGTGLAYGTGFSRDTDAGHLQFRIYRSPDAHKAFVASKKVIEDHISGDTLFDSLGLEGAVSSIVVAFADEQVSMYSAAQMSFINQVVRDLSPNYSSEILKRVRDIGVDDVKEVLKKVVLPVFEPKTANLVVTCAPVMLEEICDGFEDAGFDVQVKPLKFFHDDYGLKPKDGDEETDVEDEPEESEFASDEEAYSRDGDGSEDDKSKEL